MTNPFEKRATEYLSEDEAGFLSLVSPEPLGTYLKAHAKAGKLYDKLVCIVGTPGSGKTTMATLVEARMVETVLRETGKQEHREIVKALASCGVVARGRMSVAAVRLPMEGEYRDFWELPYDEALRTKLVLALIQARAVLGVVRNLERHRDRSAIEFVIRSDSGAALEEIGGISTQGLLERARKVEREVYRVGASLVPPKEEDINEEAVRPFRPFDVIEAVRVRNKDGSSDLLKLLVILDDAHNLAPKQFELLFRDLARREIRVSRWVMMRLDGITPEVALIGNQGSDGPEIKVDRDFTDIRLQSSEDLDRSRKAFRSLARSMASRYLRRHTVFERKQWREFDVLLSDAPPRLSDQTLSKMEAEVTRVQRNLNISPARRETLEQEVDRFVKSTKLPDTGPEVRLAMLRILLHRYVNKVPQLSLFDADANPEPRGTMTAGAGVYHGARLHLRHEYGRALHYGITALSDASSENAELFLQLAAGLVDRMEAKIINGNQPMLSAQEQDQILSSRAALIMERWNFPFATQIRSMVTGIAADCIKESRKPNAWLDAGANAIGVPQEEFTAAIRRDRTEIAQVLHYAVAYNALLLRPNYKQGGRIWCLLELGGPAILANSLTLARGGFIECWISDLHRYAGTRP